MNHVQSKYIVLGLPGLMMISISGSGTSFQQNDDLIACNLIIDHDQRMKIDAFTLIALISGGLLIAVPGDLFSRLKPMIVSLIFYGMSTLSLGFCQEYYCFASLSIFRAFWTSALLTITVVYVSETQTPRSRASDLCYLQIFWLIGLVVATIFPIPWRASQFIFGSLALVTAPLVYYFLKESPRLLLALGKLGETSGDDLSEDDAENDPKQLKTYVSMALRPPWYSVLIVLQIKFFFELCYFTMSHWFKEMSSYNVLVFAIIQNKVDCKLGDKYLTSKPEVRENNGGLDCGSPDIRAADYYRRQILLITLITLPFLIWMIARLDHLGRSYFIALSHVFVGLLSFLVHFVIGTSRGVFYTSLMSSMWIVSGTAASCLATELFRTRVRVLGVGLTNGFGYLGMTMGMYGMLSKGGTSCIFVISIAGILTTAAGLLTLALPDTAGVHLR